MALASLTIFELHVGLESLPISFIGDAMRSMRTRTIPGSPLEFRPALVISQGALKTPSRVPARAVRSISDAAKFEKGPFLYSELGGARWMQCAVGIGTDMVSDFVFFLTYASLILSSKDLKIGLGQGFSGGGRIVHKTPEKERK